MRRGKVRDIYDLGDRLLLVSTDRISAFDWVLPTGIPDKGRVLTQLSAFWFERLGVPHHLLATELDALALDDPRQRAALAGRSMLVRKTTVVPIECVVRGYLAGSGWVEYQRSGTVCGLPLPAGLSECQQLPEPIFTPATKEESGHDQNISFAEMSDRVGAALAAELRRRSLEVYARGSRGRATTRHPDRGHEIRVGPGRGQTDPDRRGPDPRQLPLLAGRSVCAGPQPALV